MVSVNCPKCNGKFIMSDIPDEKICDICGYVQPKKEIIMEENNIVEEPHAIQIRLSRKNSKRVCKQICQNFKAIKPSNKKGRYELGQVRCMTCDIFMTRDGCIDYGGNIATSETKGLRCRCCNYRVRAKPRNKIYKDKLALSLLRS